MLKVLPGWKADVRGIKNYADLPENCRKYVEFIEEQLGVPVTMVSNGPGRDELIMRKNKVKKLPQPRHSGAAAACLYRKDREWHNGKRDRSGIGFWRPV